MKLSKKLFYILPILIFIFLSSCKKETKTKIGIIQIVEHESLNLARDGFIEELKKSGYESAEFDIQIASGELSNCVSIAEKFKSDKKDLILAISTPCAQVTANIIKDTPILATAITDFEDAQIIRSKEKPDTNITGTSDLAPIDRIIELILHLNPNAKKIGILYSTTDPSPQYQAELAQKKIADLELESKVFTVSQSHEIGQAAEKLSEEVDALYTPIDKLTFSAMPQISQIFLKRGKFVVCAEESMIKKGATGVYGLSYYELGKTTAHQAIKILNGTSTPQEMPIRYIKEAKLSLNFENIKKLGITISDKLKEELQ